MRWMNARACSSARYVPTNIEHLANILTHGLVIIPVMRHSYSMITASKASTSLWAASIYGMALTLLFSTSTLFHLISFAFGQRYPLLHSALHRADRTVIYLFIAASYTPWLHLAPLKSDGEENDKHEVGIVQAVRCIIWPMAILGVIYQQMFHEKYKWLETLIYVIVGVAPAICVIEMSEEVGLQELALGGLSYLSGVIFFKLDGVIPLAHAIWHLHVVIGALLHFHAVSHYLIPHPTWQSESTSAFSTWISGSNILTWAGMADLMSFRKGLW